MEIKLIFAVGLAGLGFAFANLADTLTRCNAGGELPTEMYVKGCDVNPCTVRNGTTVEMMMVYYPPRDSEKLTANVNLMLGSLAIPFTIEDPNACNGLIDSKCPITANIPVKLEQAMEVIAPITGISVDLEYFLIDDKNDRSLCFRYRQTIVA